MLRRLDITVPDVFEEELIGLADSLTVQCFSSPCIRDCGGGEEDFEFTGETIVSFVYSTVEQNAAEIEKSIETWIASDSDIFVSNEKIKDEILSSKIIIDYREDEDWMSAFRAYFQPVHVSEKIIVRPPWSDPVENEENATVILIDPGMAFGTGTHETTRLCLRLLERVNDSGDVKGRSFADLGAGSGILSFALLKMGAREVCAIEIDGPAVENLRKNAKINGISENLKIFCKDLSHFQPEKKFDGFVANISSPILIENLNLISSFVQGKGLAIFSGINQTNSAKMREALSENNFVINSEITEGEWHAFLTTRK
ncbi:MAG: 50S ribosomal protein L11 methyltransferase [Candidatus Riflebacteria bacterium]|nr:50S ribosomal protein L11 methyltransferase [Candidatus Riflebacteria bacterium]